MDSCGEGAFRGLVAVGRERAGSTPCVLGQAGALAGRLGPGLPPPTGTLPHFFGVKSKPV